MAERIELLVFQGCRIHRGYNVANCVGCVDESLRRLVQVVQTLIDVTEERHEANAERLDATIESFKAIKTALELVKPK